MKKNKVGHEGYRYWSGKASPGSSQRLEGHEEKSNVDIEGSACSRWSGHQGPRQKHQKQSKCGWRRVKRWRNETITLRLDPQGFVSHCKGFVFVRRFCVILGFWERPQGDCEALL